MINVLMAKLADLYLVGTGIYGLSQITLGTRDIIKRCRRVFDLAHQHRFMKKLNPATVDLDSLYWTGEQREVVYEGWWRWCLRRWPRDRAWRW